LQKEREYEELQRLQEKGGGRLVIHEYNWRQKSSNSEL
jgi:hypothetical protein